MNIEPHRLFVVASPMHNIEGGLTSGGAIRVKVSDNGNAMLAFTTTEIAKEFRNLFRLENTQVIPFSELESFTSSPLQLPDQVLVFNSLADIQSMQTDPESFPFSSYLIQLPVT